MLKINYTFVFLISFLCTNIDAQVGNPAPDFTVTDTDGNTHRLYDYLEAGRIVVLDFYYTTCGPCIFYSPQVNLAYEKYGCNEAETFFLAIDYDDTNAEVEAYDEEYGIQYPSISGLNGGGNAVVNDYDIIGFPTFLVIDSTKKIIDVIDPPTLQVFDFRFGNLGIEPAACGTAVHDFQQLNANFIVYPNPVSSGDELAVEFLQEMSVQIELVIYDALGRKVFSEKIKSGPDEVYKFDISDLGPGLYWIRDTRKGFDVMMISKFIVY